MYLMISTYTAPLEKVDEVRAEHLSFIDGLEKRGLVVSAGRQDPPVGGVVLLSIPSEDEALAVMADDPYVRAGVATYTAVGWLPTRGVLAQWTA